MKPSRAPQMFITSLHMRHWRNFRGPVDMRLRRRAFLIGPNASGKSNVLDALRFLRDTAGHGLKEAVRSRGGMGEIRTLQARTPAGLTLAMQVGTDDTPNMWTLRLIGLLWSLAEGGGPLLLEEPELALHDALVRHLPRFMARMHTKSGRQVLITTHSAALLADPGIGLDEVHVLNPDSQGTDIKTGKSYQDVRAMVKSGGMSIGTALLPKTAPAHADQFSFD